MELLSSLMSWAVILITVGIGIYGVTRLVTAAYYKSRLEHLRRFKNGKR